MRRVSIAGSSGTIGTWPSTGRSAARFCPPKTLRFRRCARPTITSSSMSSVKTVLVTGGCGFIGAHFVRYLLTQTDWRVVNLDLLTYAGDLSRLQGIDTGDRYRFVRGDLADRGLLKTLFQEETPGAVVNFAAE